jgi:Domain of unknown function (DUF5134)
MSLSWALTILFAATGLWSLAGCARPASGPADKITCATHAVMAVAMIGMAWGTALPIWLPVAFYGGATLWFAGLATIPRSPGFQPTHYALMAAAMLWMVASMSTGLHQDVISLVFAWYFVFAAVPLMYRAVRRLDGAGHAAMSIGTGVLLLAML